MKMKIKLISVFVDDQEKALRFYTDVLGFIKKQDMPLGEYRWLTVVSAEGPADVELLLEPNNNAAAHSYQAALYEQGIPLAAFAVGDAQKVYQRLAELGVVFRAEPVAAGTTTINLPSTSGNLVVAKAGGAIYENTVTITANYTLSTGQNGMSVGSITIDPSVTVTIPTGQRWVIL